MKKIISVIAAAAVLLMTFSLAVCAAEASLSGPSTVRAGDTITLSFAASSNGANGFEATLLFDSSVLSFKSINNKCNGWKTEKNGNKIVTYDDDLTHPVTGKTTLFTLTFTVNGNVSAGSEISVKLTGIFSSKNENIPDAEYRVKTAAPKSGDNTLASLNVSNANLLTASSQSKTEYECAAVPFSTKSLNITAKANDSKATVKISGNQLSVGTNTVTITVTAENGSKKTYTIKVVREQDPDYKASNNTDIAEITLSSGTLSPLFEQGRNEYIVYVPFEVLNFSLSAKTSDANASASGEEKALQVGENSFVLTITAENGDKRQIKVTVMRMPEFGMQEPEPTASPTPFLEPAENETSGIKPAAIALTAIGSALLGAAICFTVIKIFFKNKNDYNDF